MSLYTHQWIEIEYFKLKTNKICIEM